MNKLDLVELIHDIERIESSIQQVWELTAYIKKVADEIYDEDQSTLNAWAMTLLGNKELIDREAVLSLRGIKELKVKLEQEQIKK